MVMVRLVALSTQSQHHGQHVTAGSTSTSMLVLLAPVLVVLPALVALLVLLLLAVLMRALVPF